MQNLLSEKPESYLQILKRSLLLYGVSIKHVFFLALLISAIAFVPRLLSILIGHDLFNQSSFLRLERLWLLFLYLVIILFFAALIWRIRCVLTQQHENLLEDVEVALRRLPYIIFAGVVQWIIFAVLGLILFGLIYLVSENFVFPVSVSKKLFEGVTLILFLLSINLLICLYVFFLFIFYLPIILIENKGVFAAIGKSVRLVWKNWWFTFWVQITPAIVYLIILALLKYGLNLPINIYFTPPIHQFSWLTTGIHIVIFALFLPWMASVLILQLRNLELKKGMS